jgi:hypothetical protein
MFDSREAGDAAIRWLVFGTAIVLLFLCVISIANARDLGQWENSDPAISEWYRSLMQPDNPGVPCCGTADAYWADKVIVRGDKAFAVITDDRPDEPLKRPHIPVGTEFEIQPSKLKYDRGNPTGHSILFVGPGGVYCYVQGTLI